MRQGIWVAALIGAVLIVALSRTLDSGSPLLTPKHLLIALVILLLIFASRNLRFWRR